jgi:tRNA 5-methylaminomethyl-2-thiouridine biosynthesis bifunctional protein
MASAPTLPDPLEDASASDAISPRLTWSQGDEPRSGRFGDVYFSADDGLAESRAVFLAGCGLPDAWIGRSRFTVAELGFGTGLNILALLDLWHRQRPKDARLNIFTIEGFPLSRDEAARALAAWPELTDIAETLLARWPDRTPGFHRVDLPEYAATVDLAVGDVGWALSQWTGRADAWFLDGFSPALNPEMWSDTVLDGIAARSAPGARLATFTVAGAVRRGLSERGFQVDKRPGHGRKRERLEAFLPSPAGEAEPRPAPVAVIGAGIAGASVARALIASGAAVTVIEAARPGAEASGFPASLVTPRLDAGDAVIAAFHAQALDRARTLYAAVPGAVLAEGVIQLEQAERDAARFAKVAAQPWWPTGAMTVLDTAETGSHLGEDSCSGALMMAQALTVSSAEILPAWLAGARVLTHRVASITPIPGGGWRLSDDDGHTIIEADVVVITAGWGSAKLHTDLDLRPVRGQANWVEGVRSHPAAWGGYAAPTATGLLFGATHDRDDTATEVRKADTDRNLKTLGSRLPRLAEDVSAVAVHAHAAIRATTRDRLPLCGPIDGLPGVFVLTGLGSRGFCVAPLLGEHLAAAITGAPSPLPATMAERLPPARLASARS